MRRSEAQREASRINGAKSNGPKTPEGLSRSSRNSLRHGILAQTVVLDQEDPERFADMLASLEAQLDPQNEIERAFVENIAIARWRTQRLWALEKAAVNDEIARQTEQDTQDPATRVARAYRGHDLFHRYEIRCDRQFYRALSHLLRWKRHNEKIPNEPTSD